MLSVLAAGSTEASAAYDYLNLGAPKFVNISHIELAKITRISKFRSMAGHNYSDSSQFGADGIKDRGVVENCSSMKHYFVAPDSGVKIYAPVSGTIGSIRVGTMGYQIEITPDAQPDFHITIFHVKFAKPLAIGDRLTEGQQIGTHIGLATWSDVSVWVQTPSGKHLISYFEVLTDAGFAGFKDRGLATRESAIRSKAERAADPRVCSFSSDQDADFVNLSGPAPATQTVTVQTRPADTMNIGDAPVTLAAAASSGLPVVFVSDTPKICTVEGTQLSARRPGVCKLRATQPGTDTFVEARPEFMRTTVLPRGRALAPPRLGNVYPPGGNGPDSYIRFYNTGFKAGTVTASLLNGETGQTVVKWQSPAIAPGAAPQFSIRDIEGTLPPGFVRPAAYSLKVEPETTVEGYLQHVLFDGNAEVLTDASTCDIGTTVNSHRLMNVHSSRLETGYPSTIVFFNFSISTTGLNVTLRDAPTGTDLGRFSSSLLPFVHGGQANIAVPNLQLVANESTIEANIYAPNNLAARGPLSPPSNFLNLVDEGAVYNSADSNFFKYFYQHLVTNRRPGVVSDLTTMCALNGRSTGTANPEMRASGVLSSLQTLARSTLRFYNSGTTAGSVKVTLYGNYEDQPLGAWVSPEIPPGAVGEYDIATIETEATPHRFDSFVPRALVKQDFYGIAMETGMDGLFQNVLSRNSGGAYTNASTCFEGVATDQKTLIAVVGSAREAEGFVSTVVVANTGAASSTATLTVVDAGDGSTLGSFQTDAIPGNGLIRLDARAIESAAGIPADAARKQYVIKADEAFSGFLQHLLSNRHQGVVSDMTAACLL